jgi:hypothetical protein
LILLKVPESRYLDLKDFWWEYAFSPWPGLLYKPRGAKFHRQMAVMPYITKYNKAFGQKYTGDL